MTAEERIQVAIERHTQAAIAYVWGRQDAGEGLRDSQAAWHFGQAYGAHRALYEREQNHWATNIRDAFEVWRIANRIPSDSTEFGQILAQISAGAKQ